ncbi:MAG: hypothetical protein ACREE0_03585 [Phenylobacterium sp.]
MRRALLPLFLMLLAATPAAAQPSDPIGALIDHRDEEPDDPAEAAEKPLPLPPLPAPEATRPAPYVAPPRRPQLTAPVRIEETGKNPDAPSVQDLAYDSRLKSSFASAQGYQGPLDGGWTLAAKGAEDLFALQLVDRTDRLEGAWRDLRRKGALDASGLVNTIERNGSDVILRFAAGGADPVTATLHGTYNGDWTGELTEGGRTRPVILLRRRP